MITIKPLVHFRAFNEQKAGKDTHRDTVAVVWTHTCRNTQTGETSEVETHRSWLNRLWLKQTVGQMMQSSETSNSCFSRCFINQASASYPEGVLAQLVRRCIKCTMTLRFRCQLWVWRRENTREAEIHRRQKTEPRQGRSDRSIDLALEEYWVISRRRHQGRPRDTVLTNIKHRFSTSSKLMLLKIQ